MVLSPAAQPLALPCASPNLWRNWTQRQVLPERARIEFLVCDGIMQFRSLPKSFRVAFPGAVLVQLGWKLWMYLLDALDTIYKLEFDFLHC